jgi:hypothetical protein
MRASSRTLPAPDAFPGRKNNFNVRVLGLGILAEKAPERAALEEHDATDTRTIFQAVPLDIYDEG